MAKAKPLTPPDPDPLAGLSEPVFTPEPPPLAEPEPDVVAPPQPEPMVAAPPTRSGGGFLAPALGGVVAAAAGFGLALYLLPDGWQGGTGLSSRIDALEAQVAALPTAAAAADPRVEELTATLADLQARLDAAPPAATADPAVAEQIAALEQRLGAVESVPMGEGGPSLAAFSALQAEIASLKQQTQAADAGGAAAVAEVEAAAKAAEDRLAEAMAEASALQTTAAEAVAQARVTAALGRVQAALDSGAPYASAVAELTEAGQTVPAALAATAETGLPSLRSLQDGFAAPARLALEAALRADPGATWSERLGTFLQSQTGARSLTPREGTDPDAILSRAEAALKGGDVSAALAELTALPSDAQTALAEWTALAQSRLDAEAALAALIGGQP